MAETIGQALARQDQAPVGTASTGLQTAGWDGLDLAVLRDPPDRLDDRQLDQVRHIASLPVPALPPAGPEFFAQAMRMLALLPRRGDDTVTGELRLALYERHFAHYPERALQFLVDEATITCRFFPSPVECKAILDRFVRRDRPARASRLAAQLARRETQTRHDDLFRRFRVEQVTQQEVDSLPARWRDHAVTLGFLRADTFALRSEHRGEQEGESPAGETDQPTGEAKGVDRPDGETIP